MGLGEKVSVIHISFAEGKHTERAELDKWILTLLQRMKKGLGSMQGYWFYTRVLF
jgi:hypothetical protein